MIEKSKGIKGENPPGPIHINIGFDEPLVDELINKKIKINKSIHKVQNTQFNIPNCRRPIIICGKIEDEFTINQIISLSEKMNAPILADPCSSLRYNTKHPNILSFYNFFIDKIKPLPDLVIRFGKKPVSKKLNDFLKKIKNKIILLTKYNGYNDDAKSIYISDFKSIKINNKCNDNWINKIQNLEKSINNKIQPYLNKKYFYEGNIIYHCLEQFENNNNLFIGNSLPIRNLENFCPNINKKINVYSNRGASGIDGLIATAIGTTYHNQESKTALIIGDISFFYDSNSLLIANKYQLNINIIILNNNGGQIFNKLPYAKNNIKDFEDFWITPIDLEIKQISKLYNANYFSLDSIESIQKKLTKIMSKSGINIIEIPCDPKTIFNIDKIVEQKF
jgi:2-succinyl-5-enolpyruvyl-6-hydroxy-3-cyclohexene-1-carboxylate synthase